MTSPSSGFLDFAGRVVVVTGASSGIGRACAIELGAHGARLLLIGRNEAGLSETCESLAGAGHEVVIHDLQQLDRIVPLVVKYASRVGRIYGLCHAAGTVSTMPLSASTVDVVQSMMTINVFAGLELARAVSRRDVMTEEGGSLLFVSSVYGKAGVPGETAYSASKGAIDAAVRAMAVELSRRRIRVNSLSPGLVRTPMTDAALTALSAAQVAAIEARHPLGSGTAVDVARAAVFLLAPATSWITGTDLAVDGGYSAQ